MKKLTFFIAGVLCAISTTALATSFVFTDQDSFADWYGEAATNMYEQGIMTGYEDGSFGASNNVNRAELAVIMDRLLGTIETDNGIDESIVSLCVENLTTQTDWYTEEAITIEVDDSYTEDDIKSLIDDYGLQLVEEDDIVFYGVEYVSVPAGEEFEWVCRLSQDNRFESVEIYQEHGFGGDEE